MTARCVSVKGMHDSLPSEVWDRHALEEQLHRLSRAYGYEEIRTPILERSDLFARAVGEGADIVEKEMYSFQDRDGTSLSLRPEGTAPCVRACLEHGLIHNQQRRLYYHGPMFRHERPQKGRYRQFDQWGLEAFGMASPLIEAELMAWCADLWRHLGVSHALRLSLNSLGEPSERVAFRAALVDFLLKHEMHLDADSRRRLEHHPLRILDSKDENTRRLLEDAPRLWDFLGEGSRAHHRTLCAHLDSLGIAYRQDPHLVRGLDYYRHTVFEWQLSEDRAQNTVCAGGRYDGLIPLLGGHPAPAVGLAVGLERLLHLVEACGSWKPRHARKVYVMAVSEEARSELLKHLTQWRALRSDLIFQMDLGSLPLKNQWKRADASLAEYAVVFDPEAAQGAVIRLKRLRDAEAGSSDVTLTSFLELLQEL